MIRKFGGSSGIDSQPAGIDIGVGGLAINGIVEEYLVQAGSTISAGDFVEFVNTDLYAATSPDSNQASGVSNMISATKLSDSSVLVVYFQDGASSGYLTAQVLTVSGTTITRGTKTVVDTPSTGYGVVKRISDTKAILAYQANYSTNVVAAVILTISGTAISIGSFTLLDPIYSGTVALEVLDINSVLIMFPNTNNSGYPTAQVLTISGTSLSAGTKYVVNTSSSVSVSLSLIEQGKVVAGFSYVSGSYHCGALKILTISGTTISAGSMKSFNAQAALDITCVATSKNYGFVVYKGFMANSTAYYMHIVAIEFNGTTVIIGSDSPYLMNVVYEYSSLNKISDGCYVLGFGDPNNSTHFAQALLINTRGNSVSIKGVPLMYSSVRTFNSNVVSLSNSMLLAVYNDLDNSRQKIILLGFGSYVRNAKSKNTIDGIAKTKAAAGETAKIYTL